MSQLYTRPGARELRDQRSVVSCKVNQTTTEMQHDNRGYKMAIEGGRKIICDDIVITKNPADI